MTVCCIVCLLQLLGGLYPDTLNYYDANVAYPGIYLGLTGNAAYVAALFCMAIPLVGAAFPMGNRRQVCFLFISLLLMSEVFLFMDIKARLVGLLCGTVFSLPLLLPLEKKARTGLMAAIIGMCFAGLIRIYFLPMRGMLPELRQILHGSVNDVFGTGRIYIWKQVLKRVPDILLFGAGSNTMIAVGIPGATFSADGISMPTAIDTAHNEYLNVLYHLGVLGLAAYMAL